MGKVINLHDGSSFMTVLAGEDDADVSAPLYAGSIDQAISEIVRVGAEFYDNQSRVEIAPYGAGRTLLMVYDARDEESQPTLLIYIADESERIEAGFNDPRTTKHVCDDDAAYVTVYANFGLGLEEAIRVRADGCDVADRVLERQEELRRQSAMRDGFVFCGFAQDTSAVAVSRMEQDQAFRSALQIEGFIDGFELLAAYKTLNTRRVPDDVRQAVLRMCQPIDSARVEDARLTATMEADARCMGIIRKFVLGHEPGIAR